MVGKPKPGQHAVALKAKGPVTRPVKKTVDRTAATAHEARKARHSQQ
jgi:hypothetical protein